MRKKKRMQFAIGIGLVASLIGLLIVHTLVNTPEASLLYYSSISEFHGSLSAGDVKPGDGVRLNGRVVPASIESDYVNHRVSFKITDRTDQAVVVPVIYGSAAVPDTFKDGADVVVEGKYESDGVFYADRLMAKCPSKYEAQDTKTGI